MILTNARVVTRDRAFLGTVEVMEQHIIAVYRGSTALPGAIDLGGDYLLPGLIDLKTSNLCRHLTRPSNIHSPFLSALLAHDAEMISAGITTAFGRLHCCDLFSRLPAPAIGELAAVFRLAAGSGLTRTDHRFATELAFAHDPRNQPLHPAGSGDSLPIEPQRSQTREELAEAVPETAPEMASASMVAAFGNCREKTLAPVYLHSNRTHKHLVGGACPGVCEFPLSHAAARTARAANLKIMVAANSLIGESDIATAELAEPESAMAMAAENLVDILSSDDYPPSLLRGAFHLYQSPRRLSLSEAIATVSVTPAQVAGLTDRGEIAPGKLADLIRVRAIEALPIAREVWRAGERVF